MPSDGVHVRPCLLFTGCTATPGKMMVRSSLRWCSSHSGIGPTGSPYSAPHAAPVPAALARAQALLPPASRCQWSPDSKLFGAGRAVACRAIAQAGPDNPHLNPSKEDIAKNKQVYTEADYVAQRQSEERAEWAANVRRATGSRHQLFWEPNLDPPALLAQVSVILVSPRRPVSLGTVARAASCFECEDVRIVAPRCNYITRHSKSASKGAQYILYRSRSYDTVQQAVADCDVSIAFTRWVKGRDNFYDLAALLTHPIIQQMIKQAPVAAAAAAAGQAPASSSAASPSGSGESQTSSGNPSHAGDSSSSSSAQGPAQEVQRQQEQGGQRPVRVGLVFGREELGMSDEEVDACTLVCSIPIGRLQESLSLSHAVSLALSSLFQHRLSHVVQQEGAAASASADSAATMQQAGAPGAQGTGVPVSAYVVQSPDGLAAGYDPTEGIEV